MFAVRGAAKALERVGGARVAEDSGYRAALLEVAIYLNTALTAFDLVRRLDRDAHKGCGSSTASSTSPPSPPSGPCRRA